MRKTKKYSDPNSANNQKLREPDKSMSNWTKGVCFASTTAVEIGVIYPGFCKNSVKYGWVLWEVAGSHQHLNPLK